MSILRTILSRPRRSHDPHLRRASGRPVLAVIALLGVSACTAVAADGLPADDGSERPVRATEAASAVAPVLLPVQTTTWRTDEPASEPVTGQPAARVGTRPVDRSAPWPGPERSPGSTSTSADGAEGAERGTIVAHAASPVVVARRRPGSGAEPVADFANPTDRGGPLVFQAIGEPRDGWLEVLLPIRPNGTTGWIDLDDVTLTRNPYRIEVDLEGFELTVRRLGQVEISAPIAVGTGRTPTPIGDFFLVELLQPPQPNGPYGSYAYGLSGYSDVLDDFNGGEGVIGIHGTNRPDLLGGPASHGCIRIHNDTIERMVEFLPLGTPVSIIESA